MFKIRRIYDSILPRNINAVKQVQSILREQFDQLPEKDIEKIPNYLRNPFKYRFKSIIFVAEKNNGTVEGFAILQHEPNLNFCLLDFLSAAKFMTGRGIGGALYERVREETAALGAIGLFFECLPDDPVLCKNADTLKNNIARLKFYERYNARPIINTKYETPYKPDTDNPPYLVFDAIDRDIRIPKTTAKNIVRGILERKYGHFKKEYIDMVVDSFTDDYIALRPLKYIRKESFNSHIIPKIPDDKKILVFANSHHSIHHIKDRGYVEAPVRINSILKYLQKSDLFKICGLKHFAEANIKSVHNNEFVDYIKKVCLNIDNNIAVYPYVFPIRNAARPPKSLEVKAGYYCIDTFTPLNKNAYIAAVEAVDAALTGADALLNGARIVYALVRPPGHHAERKAFGGFCYFNNNAIAANYLTKYGKTAILDIDYHHGNGQQDIFYERADVLTVSIHGHPNIAYPYFSGFSDEKGQGAGYGYNINIPLSENIQIDDYYNALDQSLKHIKKFGAQFLIIALGLDTSKGDPTGTWLLNKSDFYNIGKRIAALGLPVLVIQEGGYNNKVIGLNALHFFNGLYGEIKI